MTYQHKQTGKLYLLVLLPAMISALPAWSLRAIPSALAVLAAIVMVDILGAFCFRHLVVRDEGDCLALRFGPIPLLSKRLPYAQMTAVEPGRSNLLDGWGVHYCPGRGWTYNIWGCNCVKVQMGKKTVRIGTDDVAGLLAFLQTKIAKPGA
jgi:hypothetical protein